jgi:hypothetical protein
MDFNTGIPDHIEDVLAALHEGQWFGWTDSKNKVYANLIVHESYGYDKPTQEELEAALAERQAEVPWEHVRSRRDALLDDSDHVLMPDYPLADKSDWESYRQALRDVPQQDVLPDEVVWPDKP